MSTFSRQVQRWNSPRSVQDCAKLVSLEEERGWRSFVNQTRTYLYKSRSLLSCLVGFEVIMHNKYIKRLEVTFFSVLNLSIFKFIILFNFLFWWRCKLRNDSSLFLFAALNWMVIFRVCSGVSLENASWVLVFKRPDSEDSLNPFLTSMYCAKSWTIFLRKLEY